MRAVVSTKDAPAPLHFLDAPFRGRRIATLDSDVAHLVATYGFARVQTSLKNHAPRGRRPTDKFELYRLIGDAEAEFIVGRGERITQHKFIKAWQRHGLAHHAEAREKQVIRALAERETLGVAFAVNQFWHTLERDQRLALLRRAAKLALVKNEGDLGDAVRALLTGPMAALDERAPSRGLFPDPPGIPRFQWVMEFVAQRLLQLALPSGDPRQN
jgi:hypothetical protein